MRPRRHWLLVPVVLGVYAPTMLVVYGAAGRVAFGLSLVLGAIIGAVGGLGPGLVTAVAAQGLNIYLAYRLGVSEDERLPSLLIALTVSSLLASASATVRNLIHRIRSTNRELSAQIEARTKAEAILEESLTLHRSLLFSMGEGVGLFDESDHFLFANNAAEQLFDAAPGTLVGQDLRTFLPPSSRVDLTTHRASADSGPLSYDLQLATNPTRVVMVTESWIASHSPDRGRILRVLRDMTARSQLDRERRELELHLQRTEALQSLAVLAGGVAHDFNNLLSGVLGNTDLALLRLGRSPEAVRPCLLEIRHFATEASELSRHMLSYAGRRAPAFNPVDLGLEVREALRLLESTARTFGTLRATPVGTLSPIHADRVQLRQVVTNLVLNALESLVDRRGTVVLSASQVHLPSAPLVGDWRGKPPEPGDYVVLEVADDGMGMSDETLDKIFEPFFSTKFTGRGMGLAATLGIVRAHHGAILVRSEVGRGTTFQVYWPLATALLAQTSAAAPAPVDREGSLTLMVVDDEERVRTVTGQLLEELGCTVLYAGSGREALLLHETHGSLIDLVLLDLTMPEQSGMEVLASLRERGSTVRVVLTSGFDSTPQSPDAWGPGVIGFLPKPHTLEALRTMLRRSRSNSC